MPVRTGLIGFGLAGRCFHAPLVAAEPRLELAAVVTSRAEEVHGLYPDAAVLPKAEALFADPAIELVVVATPHQWHAPQARAALEAGKHVVVDKPFALRAEDATTAIALAEARGRVLTVFHNRRWDGDFLTAERLVREGALGEVLLAEMHWDRFRPEPGRGWRDGAQEGAGLLFDLGPHLIDQAIRLFGRPERVSADLAVQRAGAAADDYFSLTLQDGPRRVLLSASTLVAAPRPRFALHGTKASYVKYGIDPQEAVLRAGGASDAPGYGEEGREAWGLVTRPNGESEPIRTERGDWRRFYAGVADAILDSAPPPVDPRDALAGLELLALARQSAAEGRMLPFAG